MTSDVIPWGIDDAVGPVRSSPFASSAISAGVFTMGMFGHPAARPTFYGGDLEARAVDAAGNASAWSSVLPVPGCEPTSRPDGGYAYSWADSCVDGPHVDGDAGPSDSMDTGVTTPMDTGVEIPMDGGVGAGPSHAMACGASSGRSRPGPLLSLLALVFAVLRVRRAGVQGAVQVPR